MSIQVLYFARYREALGLGEERVDASYARDGENLRIFRRYSIMQFPTSCSLQSLCAALLRRCFAFALTVAALLAGLSPAAAQGAGVRNFDIPASPAGPAIRLLVWTPCAEPPREMDARGASFFAVPGRPGTVRI